MNTAAYVRNDTSDASVDNNSTDRTVATDIDRRATNVRARSANAPADQAHFGPQHLTELSKFLIDWATKNMPEAVDSIADNLDKPEHCLSCVGAIFRRVVKGDPPWLWKLVDARPELLLELSPHIGSIRWGSLGYPDAWGEIPGRMGWREWVRCADVAGWLSWGSAPPLMDPNASEFNQLAEIDEIVAVASRDDDQPALFAGAHQ